MRTRRARTVARSVTASTTALRSRTTRPASSAVSAVTLVIWRAIALIGSGVRAGVMTAPWVGLALLAWAAAAMLGPGHVARLAALLPGVPGTTTVTRVVPPAVLPAALRPGLVTAATAIGIVATAALMVAMEAIATILAARTHTAVLLRPLAPRPGTSPWAALRPDMVATPATVVTALLVLPRASVVLLLACRLRLRLVARLLVSLAASTLSSRSTLTPSRLRLRRRLEMRRRRLRPWTCRRLPRVLRVDASELTLLRCILHCAVGCY